MEESCASSHHLCNRALVLLWFGVDNKSLTAAGYTLGVVAFFMLADTLAECWWRAGKIEWKVV